MRSLLIAHCEITMTSHLTTGRATVSNIDETCRRELLT